MSLFSYIPHKNYRGSWDIVKQFIISRWVNARQEEKKSAYFQKELNSLLDLRPASCATLPTLKHQLKSSGNVNWEEDYSFFKGLIRFPQTTSMSSSRDQLLLNKMKMREIKTVKAQSFAEKNRSDFNTSSSKDIPSRSDVTEQNIIIKSPRESANKTKLRSIRVKGQSSTESSGEENTDTVTDGEWELPYRMKR